MAYYVYALISKEAAEKNKDLYLEGVEFSGPVRTLKVDRLRALVSEVDLNRFSEETIREKLKNDLEWLKKNIEKHFKVIERYNENGAIIPFKFAVIFKTLEGLKQSIRKEKAKFIKHLEDLEGKEEWGIKVFLNQESAAEALLAGDEEIRNMEKEISAASEGKRWFLSKREEELVGKRLEEIIKTNTGRLDETLEKTIVSCVSNEPIKRDGEKREMVVNDACLLSKEKVEDFRRDLSQLGEELKKSGLELELSGPWPPFNFSV